MFFIKVMGFRKGASASCAYPVRTTVCSVWDPVVFATGLFASLFIYLPHSGTTVLGSKRIGREDARLSTVGGRLGLG